MWRRQWHPTLVFLPGKSHGRRSLEGCSPWGRWGSDTTEWLHFHFSLSCIGGGNGNPLQCSCLENPRDWGAWWAAVYGVAQSRTWLKRLSSSSSSKVAGWHHQLDGREFEWTLWVGDGQGGLACCNSWGRKESDTTERLNWTELKVVDLNFFYHSNKKSNFIRCWMLTNLIVIVI